MTDNFKSTFLFAGITAEKNYPFTNNTIFIYEIVQRPPDRTGRDYE